MKTEIRQGKGEACKKVVAELGKTNLKLERDLAARTAELKAAHKQIAALFFALSHNLRAPLRAMNGFSQVLLEDFAPSLPAEIEGYLRTIQREARRAAKMIDDVLASTQSETAADDDVIIGTSGQLTTPKD